MKMLKELILLEAGKWVIKNAAGVEKKFPSDKPKITRIRNPWR